MRAQLTITLALLLLGFAAPASAQERIVLEREGADPARIELFITKPDGDGPFPLILFAHGHQSPPRPGGRVFTRLQGRRPALATIDEGRLEKMRDRGYVAAAVSLGGYGETPGPSDFWGPRAQASFEAALEYLIGLPIVDRDRVTVYGVSGGAATASMVAATRPIGANIRALILVAGMYDLGELYPTEDPGMNRQIEESAGATAEAAAQRAGLRYADQIRAGATLLLHGGEDRATTVSQARRMAEAIRAAGRDARSQIYEGTPHQIPIAQQWAEIDPFLQEMIGR
jgi:dipeptidyl aminopeptidase/acylaminoacyl peptidase